MGGAPFDSDEADADEDVLLDNDDLSQKKPKRRKKSKQDAAETQTTELTTKLKQQQATHKHITTLAWESITYAHTLPAGTLS